MDVERRIYDPGYVAVRNGKIAAVGAGISSLAAAERFDAADMIVLPGLVNAHNHLDQCVYRSCFDRPEPDHSLSFWHMAQGLTRERARAAASLSLLDLTHYGVTTTQESHFTHYHPDSTDGICDAILDSGMRAVVGRGFSDGPRLPEPYRERTEEVIEDLNRLEQTYDSDFITICSEPSVSIRCTSEAIVAMYEWARERGKRWHMHLGHHSQELADALEMWGMGTVQYAESLGVLGPELVAVHCTSSGLLDQEMGLLGEFRVNIAHCPPLVMRAGSVPPPIWELEKLGARVAIGVDGSNSNNGQNIWEAMKWAVYLQRSRTGDRYAGSAEQALEMTTLKAAQALGMGNRVGSLEPGKEADVALFRRDQLHLVPDARLVSNLVYSGISTRADTVLVGGKAILRSGRSTVFDENEVVARVREVQAAMIHEAGYQGRIGLSAVWPVVTQ
jgi:5-methylthioadenosine/S-adenosylhomocysteine deaminase